MQYQIVTNPYKQSDSLNRKGLLVSGDWDDTLISTIQTNKIEALYLNGSKGWAETDYSFLKSLSMIKELNIISSTSSNISALGQMNNLEELSLTLVPDSDVDFSRMKMLKKVFLEWSPKYSSIFNCTSIQDIYLNRFKMKNSDVLSRLNRTRKLTIGNSDINNIDFLQYMDDLQVVEFLNCKSIQSFDRISKCTNLKSIRIDGYKGLGTIDFLNNLSEIEIIILNDVGEIRNIKCIERLTRLKAISLAGSTNIVDGQLSYLTKLPLLSMALFLPRKHYSHKIIKNWNWNNLNIPDKILEEI